MSKIRMLMEGTEFVPSRPWNRWWTGVDWEIWENIRGYRGRECGNRMARVDVAVVVVPVVGAVVGMGCVHFRDGRCLTAYNGKYENRYKQGISDAKSKGWKAL